MSSFGCRTSRARATYSGLPRMPMSLRISCACPLSSELLRIILRTFFVCLYDKGNFVPALYLQDLSHTVQYSQDFSRMLIILRTFSACTLSSGLFTNCSLFSVLVVQCMLSSGRLANDLSSQLLANCTLYHRL